MTIVNIDWPPNAFGLNVLFRKTMPPVWLYFMSLMVMQVYGDRAEPVNSMMIGHNPLIVIVRNY